MKAPILGVAAALAVVAAAAAPKAGATGAGPALYTAAQASAGAKAYAKSCAACHGANLQGVSAPALRGDGSGLSSDTVGEAWTFISTQMPAGNPGSLKSGEYVSIIAYILARNGHRAGATALTPSSAQKSKTKV